MSERCALEIRDFTIRRFEQGVARKVFDSVTLEILDGECFGLLSLQPIPAHYLMEALVGLRSADHGSISIFGNPSDKSLDHIKRMVGIASLDQFLEPDLSVERQILFAGETFHLDREHIKDQQLMLAQQLHMEGIMDHMGEDLTPLQVRQVGLLRTLIHSPQILLIESPFEGLSPAERRKMLELLKKVRPLVRTLVVCAHDFSGLEVFFDRIAFYKEGSIVALGAGQPEIARVLGTQVVELRVTGTERDYFLKKLAAREIETLALEEAILIFLRQRTRESLIGEVLEGRYCIFRETSLQDLLLYVNARGGLL